MHAFVYIPDFSLDFANYFLRHLHPSDGSRTVIVLDKGSPIRAIFEGTKATITELPFRLALSDHIFRQNPHRAVQFYAYVAFCYCLTLAKRMCLDWMFYVESDCRFHGQSWGSIVEREIENKLCVHDAVELFGTPVCWHPWAVDIEFSRRMTNYSMQVQVDTSFPVLFEGNTIPQKRFRTALYPNGALAYYKVEPVSDYVSTFMSLLTSFLENVKEHPSYCLGREADELFRQAEAHFNAGVLYAFDLDIGINLVRRYSHSVFTRLVGLSTVLSCCRDHHISLQHRQHLLACGAKQAVHHIKASEQPFPK